ncbi:hypothetical protein G6724_00025 [Polynucleobacter paneuropaeus]|nr:hypothetical protein [Polynucleobacter paneuropaeus]
MLNFLFKWGKKSESKEIQALEQLDAPNSPKSELLTAPQAITSNEAIEPEVSVKDVSTENQILLDSLMEVQESLEGSLLNQEVLADQLRLVKESGIQFEQQKEKLAIELHAYTAKISELEAARMTAMDQFLQAEKDLVDLKNKNEHLQGVLETAKLLEQQLSVLHQEKDALVSEKAELLKTVSNNNVDEEAIQACIGDYREENFALVANLNQIQEELEQHFLQKQQVQQEYNSLQSRWKRIERNYPNLLDYDDIRLITVDSVSATPYLIWEAKNFYHANVIYPRFNMVTLLNEGRGGMSVLDPDVLGDKQAASRSLSKNIIFPYQLSNPLLIAQNYKLLGNIPWKRTLSGVALLEEILQKIWPKSKFPKDMDPSFWRSSLTQLLLDLKQLPKTVTFERVTLKRELRNVDYEHVWLEVHNLQFGNEYFIPKFEMRVGASLIQSPGFSRHPKFEFPLINGRVKPFETWYAESSDENGSKFELRFDLNKKVADFNALSKLSRPDLIFLVNVILSVPQFIQSLEDSQVPVARTWAPWKALVEEANVLVAQILQSLAVAGTRADPKAQASPVSRPGSAASIEPKKLEVEQKILKASKLVSSPKKVAAKNAAMPIKKVASKSAAKTTATVASKKVTKKK